MNIIKIMVQNNIFMNNMNIKLNIPNIIVILALIYIIYRMIIQPQIRNINYNKQIFMNEDVKKKWNGAHKIMKEELSNYAYYSFDGSNKVVSKDTFFPKTLKEIQERIKKSEGRKIRVSGGHHTFNDISISEDITIRTYNLKKILKLNKKKKQVTVEAGILLEELNIYLEKQGLSLPILPAIPYQCLGGVLATSSHGSRYNYGSMSSMIVDMTLVLADGTVTTYAEEDKEYKAVCTNLGCLGVIYSATLQCEDIFALTHKSLKIKISEFIEKYKELQEKYEFLQAYLWPYSEKQICTVYYRERKQITMDDIPRLNPKKKTTGNRTDVSHRILTKNLEASIYTEMEIAVPMKYFISALKKSVQLHKYYKEKYDYNTKYPILVRFTNEDKKSLLSMVSGRNSVFFDIFNKASLHKDPLLNKLFMEYENMMIEEFKGRPHYGKKHYLTKKKMNKIYGKNLEKFNEIRKKLDPKGMFMNDYTKRLLVGE